MELQRVSFFLLCFLLESNEWKSLLKISINVLLLRHALKYSGTFYRLLIITIFAKPHEYTSIRRARSFIIFSRVFDTKFHSFSNIRQHRVIFFFFYIRKLSREYRVKRWSEPKWRAFFDDQSSEFSWFSALARNVGQRYAMFPRKTEVWKCYAIFFSIHSGASWFSIAISGKIARSFFPSFHSTFFSGLINFSFLFSRCTQLPEHL